MEEIDKIFIIKPNGLVINKYLNNATINDLIIRFFDGIDEIRVVCPTIKTNEQIEVSCRIISELCILYEDDDSFSEDNSSNNIFAVISNSRKFAFKFPNDTVSHKAIAAVNEVFSTYIRNSDKQDFSLLRISPNGNKERINYPEDVYGILNDDNYVLNDAMRNSQHNYFGHLHDDSEFFDNKTILISSALNGCYVDVHYNLDNQPVYCTSSSGSIFTVKITQQDKGYVSLLDRKNTYLMCNYDSTNVPIEACVKVQEASNWEFFKIYSTGEHFALKSIHSKKWVSCTNGELTVSCDKNYPDIFSLFNIEFVEYEEIGDSIIRIKHISEKLTHDDICNLRV